MVLFTHMVGEEVQSYLESRRKENQKYLLNSTNN